VGAAYTKALKQGDVPEWTVLPTPIVGGIISVGGGGLGSLCGVATIIWGFGKFIGDTTGMILTVAVLLCAGAMVAVANRFLDKILPLVFVAMVVAPVLTFFLWNIR
jgi:hypothetical protein